MLHTPERMPSVSAFAYSQYLQVFGYVMFGVSALGIVQTYLQTGFSYRQEFEDEVERYTRGGQQDALGVQQKNAEALNEALRKEMEQVRAQVLASQAAVDRVTGLSANFGDADKAELISDLKAKLEGETAQALLDEIRAQAAASAKKDTRDAANRELFDESKGRLAGELRALRLRGNLNLGIGSVIAIAGLLVLGASLYQVEGEIVKVLNGTLPPGKAAEPWTALASQFAPRVTFVLFVELFAYFFLALYKTSLQEIKYFQNEMTNVEAKHIALRSALDFNNEEMVKTVVNALAGTERNHILNKDQTTVDLEKAKIDRGSRNDIISAFSEALKKMGAPHAG
jgi:hypothetical protein